MKNYVTVTITSTNRPLLLYKTLESFIKFNSYQYIKEIIIIDDSGIKNCNNIVLDLLDNSNYNYKIIYNSKNIGQISTIDKLYSLVTTEYIFHCEEDWEFYKSGFIEISLEILLTNKKIFTVWLRPYNNFKVLNNNQPIEKKIINNKYRLLKSFKERDNIWCGFTFNPGLRRLKDYKKFSLYSNIKNKDNLSGGIESVLSKLYYNNNYINVITLNNKGYVKHIGWGLQVNNNNIVSKK